MCSFSSRNFDFHLSPLSLEPRRDGLGGRQIGKAQSGSKLPLRGIGNRDGRIGKAPLPMAFGETDKNSQFSTAVTIDVATASPKQLRRNTLRSPSPSLGEVEKVMAGQLCRCTGYRSQTQLTEIGGDNQE